MSKSDSYLAPGLSFHSTSSSAKKSGRDGREPSICAFSQPVPTGLTTVEDGTSVMMASCIGSAGIIIEVKLDNDPFVDTADQSFYCDSPAARKALEQIVSHTSHILTHHYP
jgi:hypothetical protein